MNGMEQALQELAKNSPYAFIIVILLFVFYRLHHKSLHEIHELHQSYINNIQIAYKEAVEQMRENMKLLMHSRES